MRSSLASSLYWAVDLRGPRPEQEAGIKVYGPLFTKITSRHVHREPGKDGMCLRLVLYYEMAKSMISRSLGCKRLERKEYDQRVKGLYLL